MNFQSLSAMCCWNARLQSCRLGYCTICTLMALPASELDASRATRFCVVRQGMISCSRRQMVSTGHGRDPACAR